MKKALLLVVVLGTMLALTAQAEEKYTQYKRPYSCITVCRGGGSVKAVEVQVCAYSDSNAKFMAKGEACACAKKNSYYWKDCVKDMRCKVFYQSGKKCYD